jgi:hypothetical protein
MAHSLVAEGLDATVIPDDAALAEQKPTLAIIGADRVCPDGSLVNGTPSLAFAEALGRVAPLYVACETFKLDDDRHIEPGFDCVPGDLVAGYITDRGVAQPSEVRGGPAARLRHSSETRSSQTHGRSTLRRKYAPFPNAVPTTISVAEYEGGINSRYATLNDHGPDQSEPSRPSSQASNALASSTAMEPVMPNTTITMA